MDISSHVTTEGEVNFGYNDDKLILHSGTNEINNTISIKLIHDRR